MMLNSRSGELRDDMSANSSICRCSRLRAIDSKTSGSASVMNPGLLPVEWIEVPPVAHAASTRSRSPGSRLSGRWNSPRVVTMLAPDSRIRHTSSKSQPCCMYSTQSAPRARTSSIELVATTPVVATPHSSPASLPDLLRRVHVQPDELEAAGARSPPAATSSRCSPSPTGRRGTSGRSRPGFRIRPVGGGLRVHRVPVCGLPVSGLRVRFAEVGLAHLRIRLDLSG